MKMKLGTLLTLLSVLAMCITGMAQGSMQLKLRDCRQSSLGWGGVCSRAIDGNTNQKYDGNSCSHTNQEKSWWQANTERLSRIETIKIFNRIDCCSDRLNDFVITVDGHECASYKSGGHFSQKTFACNRVGQEVRIRSRKSTYLTLCEVQVFGHFVVRSTGMQLKLDNCYQSTTDANGNCHRAIDGSTNQDYFKGSCSHTKTEQSWWHGSMKGRARIKEIKIFNRLDCCSERLNNFVVKIDDHECASYTTSDFFSVMSFRCDKEGQNVIISSRLALPLTLCEVQVFGEYIEEPTVLAGQLQLTGCSQSSLAWRGACSRAIDGNTNPFYFGQSCTHTKQEKGWWMAQTKRLAHIQEVQIFNRVDCCADRLNDFVITVDGQECASYKSGTSFIAHIFKCDKVGRSVMIKSRMRTFLTLCEVRVFGTYDDLSK